MPSEKLFPVLHELCGNETLSQIALVTTMWDGVDDSQRAHEKLAEIKNGYWGVMEKHGSTHCHSNTPESAKAILQSILEKRGTRYRGTSLQLKFWRLKAEEDSEGIGTTFPRQSVRFPTLARALVQLLGSRSVRPSLFSLLL